MYVYFDKQGKIVEVINDLPLRQGSNNANTISMYFEDENNFSLRTRYWIRFRKNDGTETNEIQIDRTKVRKTIPYNKHRDMKFFKDYKEYNFIEYTLGSEELALDGLLLATVRVVIPREATVPAQIVAQGLLTMNVEQGVITEDLGITQSQFDYLLDVIAKIGLDNEVPPQEIVFKGSFDTFAELEQEGERVIGYTYKVEEEHEGNHAGTNYTWNGTAWSPIGGGFDLSNYYIKKVVDDKDAKVLKDAKDYTDASIVGVFYTKGQTDYLDAQTLENAKEYADEKISEVYDKAEVLDLVANAKSYAVEQDILVKNFVELNYAKKSDIAGFYKFVSTIATYELLLTDGVRLNGNVYEITQASGGYPAGMNFAWSDAKNEWDALGGNFNIGDYTYDKDTINSKVTGSLTDANNYTDAIIGQIVEIFENYQGEVADRFDAVDESVATKQATLVSGTNIKTINGETLLGSGNLEIQGGGGSGGLAEIVEILSGAGTSTNPYVIDKAFEDEKLYMFKVRFSNITGNIIQNSSVYFTYNNETLYVKIYALTFQTSTNPNLEETKLNILLPKGYNDKMKVVFSPFFTYDSINKYINFNERRSFTNGQTNGLIYTDGNTISNNYKLLEKGKNGQGLRSSGTSNPYWSDLKTFIYDTGQTLEQKLATLGGSVDLSNYYNKAEVDSKDTGTLTSANNYTDLAVADKLNKISDFSLLPDTIILGAGNDKKVKGSSITISTNPLDDATNKVPTNKVVKDYVDSKVLPLLTPTLSTIAYTLNLATQEINLNETLKIGGRYIISAKGGQYNGYYEFVFLGMDESVPIIKLVPMALNDGGNIHYVFLSVSSNSIEVTGDGEDLELLSEGQLRIFKLE